MAPHSERLAELRASLRELEACVAKFRGTEWPAPRVPLGQARLPDSYFRGAAGDAPASDPSSTPQPIIVRPLWRQRLRAVVAWCGRSWRNRKVPGFRFG